MRPPNEALTVTAEGATMAASDKSPQAVLPFALMNALSSSASEGPPFCPTTSLSATSVTSAAAAAWNATAARTTAAVAAAPSAVQRARGSTTEMGIGMGECAQTTLRTLSCRQAPTVRVLLIIPLSSDALDITANSAPRGVRPLHDVEELEAVAAHCARSLNPRHRLWPSLETTLHTETVSIASRPWDAKEIRWVVGWAIS